ncbi:MAG: 3-hydroxyacyl-CoA dehydrogenase family protein [Candidatus Nezhaarchaeota archaeon]|nr:3-hydroxyacyl-CoA dehydrogenase family protein [Candidatus Nezhaarchaeota archaeon]
MKRINIKKVAVLGAGTMGHGIAQVCAQSGYETVMVDIKPEILVRALNNIRKNLEILVRKSLIRQDDIEKIVSRITTELSVSKAVKDVDLVIEAVVENFEVKKRVFKEVDDNAPSHAILSTNTSTISITELAKVTQRPQMVLGMHFWNPPHLMPLVEIVKTEYTLDEIVEAARTFVEGLGKVPVVCRKETPGYLGVRLQAAIVLEAIRMLEEGVASVEDIDTAVKMTLGLRYPLFGPLQVVDLGGVDIFYNAYEYLYAMTKEERFKPPKTLKELVEKGKLGIKSYEGFYKYTPEQVEGIVKLRDEWLIDQLISRGLLKVAR